ncbi:hypothetical protein K490DRAFT_65491 [Saccharata proteae CBS 121410]|uniref:Uncharacterized protein n=1 Tax=Saccharata proteae CBS 121410 TaxID=1314787 RepID=A0A9P4HY12_9PEZI|nr:hypothetical protein K490DRAFT_65491 [Saccharata proteae CBS 121410]
MPSHSCQKKKDRLAQSASNGHVNPLPGFLGTTPNGVDAKSRLSHYPDGNVATIKLAHENGRPWSGWMREEQKPPLALEAYVQGEVRIKESEQNISLDAKAMSDFLDEIEKEEDDDVFEEMLDSKVDLTVGELLALAPELEYRVMGGRMKQWPVMRRPEKLGPGHLRRDSSQAKSTVSRYQFVKMHWGSSMNFMQSHRLKPTLEGFEEAKSILDTYFQEQIPEEAQEREIKQSDEVELLGVHCAKLAFFVGAADIVPILRAPSVSSWFA